MGDHWGTYLFDLGEKFDLASQIEPGLRKRLGNRSYLELRERLDIGGELWLHLDGEMGR